MEEGFGFTGCWMTASTVCIRFPGLFSHPELRQRRLRGWGPSSSQPAAGRRVSLNNPDATVRQFVRAHNDLTRVRPSLQSVIRLGKRLLEVGMTSTKTH